MKNRSNAIHLLATEALAAALIGSWLLPGTAGAGKLDDMGDAARGGAAGDDRRDDEGDDTQFLWDAESENDDPWRYLGEGGGGETNVDRGEGEEEETERPAASGSVRAGYQYVLDGVHVGAIALVVALGRFEIRADTRLFTEPLPGERPSQLFLGEAGIGYRVVRLRHFLVRTGVGFRVLVDRYGGVPGFSCSLGAAVAPVDHLLISVDGDVGNVGYALYAGGQGRIAARIAAFELYAGWDAHVIGDVLVHGPIAGLGLRF